MGYYSQFLLSKELGKVKPYKRRRKHAILSWTQSAVSLWAKVTEKMQITIK